MRVIAFLRILFVTSVACAFLTSCGKTITKAEAFPGMYEKPPLSILVLPPVNQSTAADAKEFYSTTIAEPLTLSGYYVYPIEVVGEVLKSEGAYETETLLKTPPSKFKEYFGADAVLYIKILKWDKSYYVIGGNVTVSVDFQLVSTGSGKELWRYNGTFTVNTSGNNNSGGLIGLVANLVETAVKTATTDYVPIAKQANVQALLSIPYGKYNKRFNIDKTDQVVQQKKLNSTGQITK